MKKKKIILAIAYSTVTVIALAVAVPFTILAIRTNQLNKDYSYLKNDSEYSTNVEITGLNLVEQKISCGYASIEMLSEYYGNKVSEDDLSNKNKGAITTSSSDGFLKEINKSIPSKTFIKKSYLKNDSLLKEIHNSLKNSHPVALEWAAKYQDEWTLHFSVISGLDLTNDNVKIYNPYGYIENITVEEFIARTSFNAYKNLPLFLNFGFVFGAFEKNTIFFAK